MTNFLYVFRTRWNADPRQAVSLSQFVLIQLMRDVIWAVCALVPISIIAVVRWLWPQVIPFHLFEFWAFKGPYDQLILMALGLLAVGFVINLPKLILTLNHPQMSQQAETVFKFGFLISLRAGILEELVFRWLLFYSWMWILYLLNRIIFSAPELVYTHYFADILNATTARQLAPFFLSMAWNVGAAIGVSNGKFRDGHLYQGKTGVAIAYLVGFFFFYIMFHHGLVAAMIIHAVYDMFIFGLLYMDMAAERKILPILVERYRHNRLFITVLRLLIPARSRE
ncbi:hypothetical protein A2154_01820 [Candidatus Gottesmanbacteria bacterium RBG_16_43_7]|uniref:Uncharacterized protein n=1 Tax=Candidatus Gottesmanbacteria bacterium RBG_16_43_7 TaxID=1798373 RepID=A0A1F5Z9F2_9BACT|nr:MAG: hypothetical protein A2154_01820 [Candidatus Gottesmanbacteria bacterium RBG_16_43_7]